ncbi:Mitochondrial tRNA methylthiotransferase CDK5RAP1 [Geodia barretti]|uniref:Mitochondrial tRNA methylthiotransferase CDK5RAP1 n=4 Tax=Geodia barretti TaxID=519541 RepID=A0AA35TUW9_GEOBA|nr:Mitochondrial tRNA methylthiotransferase CDK5RAP1 [Geodia barretti]
MAERLKKKILETDKMVDLVAGPDSYRSLPQLLAVTETGQSAVNVLLSLDETYADVMPVRINSDSPSAYISIMRGCENMCSFCIVPFTRGRERSRPTDSILQEVKMLSDQGVKEVTLLGQNVNSYRDLSQTTVPVSFSTDTRLSRGFSTIYRTRQGGRRFADLMDKVSLVDPEMRIRFTSPHPKDFPDELLYLIRERANVCNLVHMPAQSGNTEVLKRMRRGYTRESYLELVENIWSIIPDVSLSSDFIAGFCGETDEEHRDTISLLDTVKFDMAYMFAYSMRKKTHAHHAMQDDVLEEVKKRRLQEIIDTFYSHVGERNRRLVGSHQLVLVEGTSKRSEEEVAGRTDGNVKVIFPGSMTEPLTQSSTTFRPGDYVIVKITEARDGSVRLRGVPVRLSSILDFSRNQISDSDQPTNHKSLSNSTS